MSTGEQRYAIVTGANEPSIGFLTAKRLADPVYNFRVVLACRDEAKGKQAIMDILKENPVANVCYLHLDLASLASVRAFVQDFIDLDNKPSKSLSVLVNNAGVGFGKDKTRSETEDGFELRFGVNHLGHFLLTNLLLPSLKRASNPAARIVNVSSSLHDPAKPGMGPSKEPDLNFDDLQMKNDDPFDPTYAYKVSKLCNVLFTYELQRRLHSEGSKAVVNAMCPGFIPSSGLVRDAGACGIFFLRYVMDGFCSCLFRITRSRDDGAECQIRCAVDAMASHGGEYFEFTRDGEFRAIKSSEISYDEAKAKRLWEVSAKLTGFIG